MKDWVGQAGMLSGAGLASGANFLNLSCWKRDKQSAITFSVLVIWVIHTLILYLAAE